MRCAWTDLPPELRSAIAAQTGTVSDTRTAPGGSNTAFAATLTASARRVFVKAAPIRPDGQDGPQVRALRREAAVNPCLPDFAPRLLWTAEAGGWLAVGFEHVQARHADYQPGSSDLHALTALLHNLQETPRPVVVVMAVERRWEPLADDASAMAGDALLHTDLNPHNLLISETGRAVAVDWAFASKGAPWVELCQVIPWLLRAGHQPAEAEAWARQFPSWTAAEPRAITQHAILSAERWRRRHSAHASPGVHASLAVAQQWAQHRLH
ncbi:phosphotransferase [Spirillospora sp. NPDC052269]